MRTSLFAAASLTGALFLTGCGGGAGGAGTATSSAFTTTSTASASTVTTGASVAGTSVETRTISFGTAGSRGYVPVTVQLGAGGTPYYVAPDAVDSASFPGTANTSILLTAPASYADRQFVAWQWAGQTVGTSNTMTTSATQLTGSGPLVAVFEPMTPPSAGFTPNFTRANFPHWSQFPVTVYFDSTIAAGSSKQSSILNGMNRWVNASGGLISYQIVTDPTLADITVGFGATPTGLVALTTANWDASYNLLSATVALNPPVLPANEVSTQNLDTIMAHEFGHALGMISDTDLTAGHSSDSHDTMYPTGNSSIGMITADDINTMATNYEGIFTGNASGKSMTIVHGAARRAAAVGAIHKASID